MPPPQNLRATGDRIEQMLDDLEARADPRLYDQASEILRLVVELYGAGLTRTVELGCERDPGLMDVLAGDELVGSLLLVHGLHPESLDQRVEGALARVRPLLAAHGGDAELVGIDAEAGMVRLRLLGNCDGCPSSAVTLRLAVEQAVVAAAPEIVGIEVDEPPPPTGEGVPVAIGAKPRFDECPAEVVPT
jgi:Fe-S cluster biogenesis protein NfuA